MTIKYKIKYLDCHVEERSMKISNGNPRSEYAISCCIANLFSTINSQGLDARFPSDKAPKGERLYAYAGDICSQTYYDFQKE